MQNKSITQKSHSVLSARKTFIFSSHFYAAINSTQPANKGWNQMTNIFNNLQLDWVMPRCLLSSGSARRWESGWWRSTTRRRGHFNDNFTPTTRPTAPFFSKLLCLWKGVDRGGSHLHSGSTSLASLITRVCSGVAHRWTHGGQPNPAAIYPTLLFLPRGCSGFCKLTIDDMQRDGYRWTVRWAARIVPGVFFPCRFDDQWANLRNWIWNGKKI